VPEQYKATRHAGNPFWLDPNTLTNYFQSDMAVRYPSTTPFFVDSDWPDMWPMPTDEPSSDLFEFHPTENVSGGMNVATIARHGLAPGSSYSDVDTSVPLPGKVNVGLADGHVEMSELDSLWFYTWNAGYAVPTIRPGLK
jgi:prepilin-type processing-associated H-X9-DG protein